MIRKFVAMCLLLSPGVTVAGDMSVGDLAGIIAKDVIVSIENATVDAQKGLSPQWRKVKFDKETSKAYLNKERGFYWALKNSEESRHFGDVDETRDWQFFFRAIVHYQEDDIGRVGMMDREATGEEGIRVRIPDFKNQRPDMLSHKFIKPTKISGIAVLSPKGQSDNEVAVPTAKLRYVLSGQGHNAIPTPANWQPYLYGQVRNIFSDGYLLIELIAMAQESHGETSPLPTDDPYYALVPETEVSSW